MKTEFLIAAVSFVFLWGGCDSNVGPAPIPVSGRATINSKVLNSQSSGLSFSEGTVILFPNSQESLPDIMVLVQTDAQASIIGVFLGSPGSLRPTFRLLKQYALLDSAVAYYQALSYLPDTTFTELAIPTVTGQVWAVKTREDKYAKILIRSTVAYADTSDPSAPTPYGEVTLDWTYQPNGNRQF